LKTSGGAQPLAGSSPAASACEVITVPWPSGEGGSLTRRRSVVRVHPGPLESEIRSQRSEVSRSEAATDNGPRTTDNVRPRGAARSARQPVTLEIVGSNPTGDARPARYANRQSGEAQNFVPAGSTPARAIGKTSTCVGRALASPGGCNPPATGCAGSTPARRTDRDGPFVYRSRTPASHAGKAGSIPARVTRKRPGGETGRHAALRTLCPRGVGVRLSPWSLSGVRKQESGVSRGT
jgi:hypothetical protein